MGLKYLFQQSNVDFEPRSTKQQLMRMKNQGMLTNDELSELNDCLESRSQIDYRVLEQEIERIIKENELSQESQQAIEQRLTYFIGMLE